MLTCVLKKYDHDQPATGGSLGKKGAAIASAMFESQSAILNQICDTRANYVGACRFFNNPKVSLENLIQIGVIPSVEAVQGQDVLCIQDTSEIELTNNSGKYRLSDPDLGPLTKETMCGFLLHPSLVLNAVTGFPLALADIYIWNRKFGKEDKHGRNYASLPIEEKESYRWPQRAAAAKEQLAKARQVTIIADREADIYEEFALLPDQKTHLLIRSKSNRQLHGRPDKLFEAIGAERAAACITLEIKANKKRRNRTAQLELRFLKVRLQRPKNANKQLPDHVGLYAVEVRELAHSVPKGEEPILWRLLTTHAVDNAGQALQIVQWYAWRWNIEQLFRILKTEGLQIQRSQLETGIALKKLCVMALQTALEIMQLIADRDNESQQRATIIFSKEELIFIKTLILTKLNGKTSLQQNPHPENSLAWASWAVGRLGGWKGYPSESPPGPITMLRGLTKFQQLFEGWRLARQFADWPSHEPPKQNQ
jgi:hypothetical protein